MAVAEERIERAPVGRHGQGRNGLPGQERAADLQIGRTDGQDPTGAGGVDRLAVRADHDPATGRSARLVAELGQDDAGPGQRLDARRTEDRVGDGVDLDHQPEGGIRRVDRAALGARGQPPVRCRGGIVGPGRREVQAERPAVDRVQGVDERVLETSVQGEDGPVVAPDLAERVAGHRLVDVALVDDDPVLEPTAGDVDGPDLVSTPGVRIEVFDDVQGGAVGRQRVVVEPTGELDHPGLPRDALGEDRQPRLASDGRLGLDEDDGRPVRRHADGDRVGPDRRQPPVAGDRRRRAIEAGLDDHVADDGLDAIRVGHDQAAPIRVERHPDRKRVEHPIRFPRWPGSPRASRRPCARRPARRQARPG